MSPQALGYVPVQRDLTPRELAITRTLVMNEAPERLAEIEALRVSAVCSCGKCPTVRFAPHQSPPPNASVNHTLAEYCGVLKNGDVVGVSLTVLSNQIAVLEAWSISGGAFDEWPNPLSLKRV